MTAIDTGPDLKPVDNDDELKVEFVEEPTYNPLELSTGPSHFGLCGFSKSWIGIDPMIKSLRP